MKAVLNSTVEKTHVSNGYLIALMVAKSFAIVLGVGGNLLVILHEVFLRFEKSPQTYLIVNLAVSDILSCLTIFPIRIVKSIMMLSENGKRSSMFCKINFFGASFCVCLSVLTLVAVTYDRYLSIKRPLKYPMLMTRRKVCGIIGLIWSGSSIYLPFAVFLVETSDAQLNSGCTIVREGLSALIILFVFIPLTVIFFFNFKTWRIAHAQRRSIARNTVMDSNAECINFSKRIAKELKAVKTFGMILGVLFLCFTPFALTVLFSLVHFNAGLPPLVHALFMDLVGLNSVFNPLIYGLRQKVYRKEIRRFFARLCC